MNSSHAVQDSFEFAKSIQQYDSGSSEGFMCSYDVVRLFTNVPIIETIDICLKALYHSDINPPEIEETLLRKLLYKSTRDVEFSFNNHDNNMFKQTDGVAMGSPLGPVFVNIFLGYCETLIPDEFWPEIYTRYVDDTFFILHPAGSCINLS